MKRDLAGRIDRVRAASRAAGLDALLLTPGADLRYLTGYDALPLERLTCLVLPVDGPPALVVPALEQPRAAASPAAALPLEVVGWAETEDPYRLAAHLLRDALGRAPLRVGVANRMWAEQVLRLREALPAVEQQLAGDVLRELRIVKTPDEVAALRRAGAAIDAVHEQLRSWRWVGRREREVGRDVAEAIVGAGHARVNFVIVASGPNGASPHHDTGERRIERGDVVVVDIGGTTADGYCSDSTRTYVAGGEPPADFLGCYRVLQAAQQAAVAAVRPGVTAESIDAAARQIISEAGYGEQFVHRTGHGIGLEEHEEPWIVGGNHEQVRAGMAFSVEPGIYLPGRHGARIEDIVVVTDDGAERLNRTTRELVALDG